MFIDEVIIDLEAGDGGNGCLAFRREKFIEMGGPFGGDGGKGSDIIFKVDEGLNTLLDLRYKKLIRGIKGENGLGKGMHGKNAEDIIIKVPQGTIITDYDTGLVIADLVNKDDQTIVAKGGRGGRGNMSFRTHSNPAPNFAENGEPGEIRRVKVELKLLADVGLVGMPSVGKSTFISKISSAKPKIADYPFTTLKPILGMVAASNNRSFVVSDLPGLIKGASEGYGLGHQFLKHIERTRIIAHIIDMSGLTSNPYEDYITINKELENYNKSLLEKPQLVIANKMDMEISKENLKKFKELVNVEVYEMSALNNEGIAGIVNKLADMLDNIPKKPIYEEKQYEDHVLYKYESQEPFKIIKENNIWVIKGESVEKLLKMTRFSSDEAILRFSNRLRKLGVDDKLRELGAKEGDTIRILDFEFEYKM